MSNVQPIRVRIVAYLNAHPEGVDDDVLTAELGMKRRVQANIACRKLAEQRLVERRTVDGKIRNFATGATPPPPKAVDTAGRHWYWEGCVQNSVAQFLRENGYHIVHTANTVSHEHGKDIVAEKDGRLLWVSVKGYPSGPNRANYGPQTSVWLKDAFFDMVVYRGQSDEAELALAFPDFERYHKLLDKVAWLQPTIKFSLFWVTENGAVRREWD